MEKDERVHETIAMSVKYGPPTLRYPGGKHRVAKKIAAMMPDHKVYVEPFCGASHVFFAKPRVKRNILNDKNHDLIGFFKSVKGRKVCCDITPDKEKFLRLREKKHVSPCEYIYINKNSYGGKSFGTKPTYGYVEHNKQKKMCIDGSVLNNVALLNQDFSSVIKKYDGKETLFYVDPPYVKANQKECLYGKGFCSVSPESVASALSHIRGKAIVSYDDHPDVRKAFKGWKVSKITLPYSLAKVGGTDKIKGNTEELIIKNY